MPRPALASFVGPLRTSFLAAPLAMTMACAALQALPTATHNGDLKLAGSAGLDQVANYARLNGDLVLDLTAVSVVSLPHLREVQGDLILQNVEASSVDLSGLRRIAGNLRCTNSTESPPPPRKAPRLRPRAPNDALKSHEPPPHLDLRRLEHVEGNVELAACGAVRHLNLSSLAQIDGALTIQRQNNLSSIILPKLAKLTSLLTVGANAKLKTIEAPLLKKAAAVRIAGNRRLQGIDLASLESVPGPLAIEDNNQLIALRLTTLKTVGVGVGVGVGVDVDVGVGVGADADADADVDADVKSDANASDAASLTITRSAVLQQVKLPALRQIGTHLRISDHPQLHAILAPALKSIGGSLDLQGNPQLAVLRSTLQSLGSDLLLDGTTSLQQIQLANLHTVGGDFELGSIVNSMKRLTHLDLQELRKVDGRLVLHGAGIESLVLPFLKSVGQRLSIERNEHLRHLDLSALNMTSGTVYIANNALPECAVASVRTRLQGSGAQASINADEPGCVRRAFSPAELARVAARGRPDLETCLNDGGIEGSVAPGEHALHFSWEVTPEGNVESVKLTNPNGVYAPRLHHCIVTAAKHWTFPKKMGQGTSVEAQIITIRLRAPWISGAPAGASVITSVHGLPAQAHAHAVTDVAFSTDGNHAATASLDGTVWLWNVATATPRLVLRAGKQPVLSARFARQNTLLVSGGQDGMLRVWSVATGDLIGSADVAAPITTLRVVLSHVWVGDRAGLVTRWSLPEQTADAPAQDPHSAMNPQLVDKVFSFDGFGDDEQELVGLVVAADGTLAAAASADGRLTWRPGAASGQKHVADGSTPWLRRLGVAMSPDGALLMATAVGREDSGLRVWRTSDWTSIPAPPFAQGVYAPGFLADGSKAYVVSDEFLYMWSVIAGSKDYAWQRPEKFQLMHEGIVAVSTSPDGSTVLAGGDRGSVEFWHAPRRATVRATRGHMGRITSLSADDAGSIVLSTAAGEDLRSWSFSKAAENSSESEVLSFSAVDPQRHQWVAAVAPGGDGFFAGDSQGRVYLWGKEQGRAEAQNLNAHGAAVVTVAFADLSGPAFDTSKSSWQRSVRLSADAEGRVLIWRDFAAEPSLVFRGHGSAPVRSAAFVRGGDFVVSAAAGGQVLFWDAHTGEVQRVFNVADLRAADVTKVVVTPDRGRVFAALDRRVTSWDLTTGERTPTFNNAAREILDIAISPDGRRLAAVGLDETLHLWNAGTLKYERAIDLSARPGDYPTAVTFVGDAEHLAVGLRGGQWLRIQLQPTQPNAAVR